MLTAIHLATVQGLVIDLRRCTEISRLYQTWYQRILIKYPIKLITKYTSRVPSEHVC